MARVEYHKKRATSKKWILVGFLISFILVATSLFLLFYQFASQVKEEYLQGDYPIIFNGEQRANAYLERDTIYIPLTFMQKYIDQHMIYDEKSKSVIITTQDKVIQMPADSLTYYVNQKPVKLQIPFLKADNGERYVALEPLQKIYPLTFKKLPETKAIWIQKDGEKWFSGTFTKEDVSNAKRRLRVKPDLQSPYTAELATNESVHIEKESGDYYFVRKKNGYAGYVQKDIITKNEQQQITLKSDKKKAILKKMTGPVQLTWEAVYTQNPNPTAIPEMPGVNVVSPTWFSLAKEDGTLKNLASLEYSKWAKNRSYQVWALFSNNFDPALTHQAFSHFETRQHMIRQLLHFSQMYQLDGINIDIENVKEADGPLITQFIREATPLLHEAGLTVSMDVTFDVGGGDWSAFYEREKLSNIVDYMIVMAYDEHWGSSPTAGSVASFPWVENHLQNLLKVVPNEKLVLGVPLYTRLWKEQTEVDGSLKVTSKALSMEQAKEWLAKNKLTPKYDEATGQNYTELHVDAEKATYKIWLEDEQSLKKRADLAAKYQLAGVASWSRYFADSAAWTALNMQDVKQVSKK